MGVKTQLWVPGDGLLDFGKVGQRTASHREADQREATREGVREPCDDVIGLCPRTRGHRHETGTLALRGRSLMASSSSGPRDLRAIEALLKPSFAGVSDRDDDVCGSGTAYVGFVTG